jgi:hypothetical protein
MFDIGIVALQCFLNDDIFLFEFIDIKTLLDNKKLLTQINEA